MGSVTPRNFEYNLLSGFVEEALSLLGQECQLYITRDSIDETTSKAIVGSAIVGKAIVDKVMRNITTSSAIVGEAIVGQAIVDKVIVDVPSLEETKSDSILYYEEPFNSFILFEDDLKDVKLNKSYWDKETDLDLIAYVSLSDLFTLTKNSIVKVTPSFYNKCSTWLVTDIFGQVNSTYARVRLVPYRESLRTSTDENKDISTTYESGGVIYRKGYLKR